jgi:hypothetical protein
MRLIVDEHYRVNAACTLEVQLPAGAVWGQMRDVARFLSTDPLHARVLFPAGPPDLSKPRGTLVRLQHRFLGVGPDRVGRILAWSEGRGYAVSDLSRRGNRVGFPHVCTYRVDPIGIGRSRITLGARGRWTATWLPRPLVRLWICWVFLATRHHVGRELDVLAAWLVCPRAT